MAGQRGNRSELYEKYGEYEGYSPGFDPSVVPENELRPAARSSGRSEACSTFGGNQDCNLMTAGATVRSMSPAASSISATAR